MTAAYRSLLGLEVVEQRGVREARAPGDVLQPGAAEAVLGELAAAPPRGSALGNSSVRCRGACSRADDKRTERDY